MEDHGSIAFELPKVPDHPEEELLRWEKDLIGFYLSRHPLMHLEAFLRPRVTTFIPGLNEEWAGQPITLGGRIVDVRRIVTKKGTTMAILQFEDLLGSIEITVFPRLYAELVDLWHEEARLFITGKIEMRDEDVRLIAEKAEAIVVGEDDIPKRLHHLRIRLQRSGNETRDILAAKEVMEKIRKYAGADTFELHLPIPGADKRIAIIQPQDNHIRYCPELQSELEAILGSGAVSVGLPDEAAVPEREMATAV